MHSVRGGQTKIQFRGARSHPWKRHGAIHILAIVVGAALSPMACAMFGRVALCGAGTNPPAPYFPVRKDIEAWQVLTLFKRPEPGLLTQAEANGSWQSIYRDGSP